VRVSEPIFPSRGCDPVSPAREKLMRETDRILAMAEDLGNRGFAAEAATFALIAAQRLQAIRALEEIAEIAKRPGGVGQIARDALRVIR
jgi:hypothetical protein